MSQYLLVIYQEKLTEQETSTLSGICNDVQIEEIDRETSNSIANGYYHRFEYDDLAYCYRFFMDQIQPGMFLIGKNPDYVGQFYRDNEMRCAELSTFCANASAHFDDIEGIGRIARNHAIHFSNVVGAKSEVDSDAAASFEQAFINDLDTARGAMEMLFEKARLF